MVAQPLLFCDFYSYHLPDMFVLLPENYAKFYLKFRIVGKKSTFAAIVFSIIYVVSVMLRPSVNPDVLYRLYRYWYIYEPTRQTGL